MRILRLPCVFRSSASSSMKVLMMRLLIILMSHGSCRSGGVDCSRCSGRTLTFNEKVASSNPYMVCMTKDALAKEATA